MAGMKGFYDWEVGAGNMSGDWTIGIPSSETENRTTRFLFGSAAILCGSASRPSPNPFPEVGLTRTRSFASQGFPWFAHLPA